MNGQGRTPETSFLLMPLNFENPAQILEKNAKLPLTNEVASVCCYGQYWDSCKSDYINCNCWSEA